jgi:hypothetical protein
MATAKAATPKGTVTSPIHTSVSTPTHLTITTHHGHSHSHGHHHQGVGTGNMSLLSTSIGGTPTGSGGGGAATHSQSLDDLRSPNSSNGALVPSDTCSHDSLSIERKELRMTTSTMTTATGLHTAKVC